VSPIGIAETENPKSALLKQAGRARAQRSDCADEGGPFGFEKKPKYKQSKKKMRCGIERRPLIFGMKTRLVPKSGTDTFARYK
jgi:hypothetical protein